MRGMLSFLSSGFWFGLAVASTVTFRDWVYNLEWIGVVYFIIGLILFLLGVMSEFRETDDDFDGRDDGYS